MGMRGQTTDDSRNGDPANGRVGTHGVAMEFSKDSDDSHCRWHDSKVRSSADSRQRQHAGRSLPIQAGLGNLQPRLVSSGPARRYLISRAPV
jgi:hypothetical protein